MASGVLRSEIMALPEAERLPWALSIIDRLTDPDVAARAALRAAWRLTEREAQLVHYLAACAPMTATPGMIHTAIYGSLGDPDIRIVNVFVCKARAKMRTAGAEARIINEWGFGYRFEGALPPPPSRALADVLGTRVVADEGGAGLRPSRVGDVWTDQDLADLRRMVESGSSMAALVAEFDRSERAIQDRVRQLFGCALNVVQGRDRYGRIA